MALLNNYLTDGDFTTPYAVSPPRFSQPFEGDSGAYVLEQDFWVHENHFQSLPLNTPHESKNNDPSLTYANYILVKESPTVKVGNGILSWTRTYAQIPKSRNDYSTIVYKFPGFSGAIYPAIANTTVIPGRLPGNYTVTCKIQNDYFLVKNGVATIYDTTSVVNPEAIVQILKQRYYIPVGTWSVGTFVPFYTDPVQAALQGMQVDSIWDTTGTFSSNISPACVPSLTLYRSWIDQKLYIAAEDSTISRWMGNIFVRVTKFVVAQ